MSGYADDDDYIRTLALAVRTAWYNDLVGAVVVIATMVCFLECIVRSVRRRNWSGCINCCGGILWHCCWMRANGDHDDLAFHGGWAKYKQTNFRILQILVAATLPPCVLLQNAILEWQGNNVSNHISFELHNISGMPRISSIVEDPVICIQIALGYTCIADAFLRGPQYMQSMRERVELTCDDDLKIKTQLEYFAPDPRYEDNFMAIDDHFDFEKWSPRPGLRAGIGYDENNLTHTYDAGVGCYSFHDQNPVIWFDAIAIAGGIVGVLLYIYLQLDWLVSIGVNEPRSQGQWKRSLLTLILAVGLVGLGAGFILLEITLSSKSSSMRIEMYTALIGLIGWFYVAVAYISKYDVGTDRHAILTALFEAYSSDSTVDGYWTPESTSKLAAHLKPTSATPDPKALLQLSGSELWLKMTKAPIGSADVEASDRMNFGILTFICALKKVPVTFHAYTNPNAAGSLSFGEVWNGTWDVMKTELDTRDTDCKYEWWNMDTKVEADADSVAVNISVPVTNAKTTITAATTKTTNNASFGFDNADLTGC